MLEVNWVVSVQVGSNGDTVGVTRPKCECRVLSGEVEGVGMLAETVDVRVGGKVGFDAQVLGLEDEGMRSGGEENLAVGGAVDGEGEGGGGIVELDGSGARRNCTRGAGTGEDTLGHFITCRGGVGNFDVYTLT